MNYKRVIRTLMSTMKNICLRIFSTFNEDMLDPIGGDFGGRHLGFLMRKILRGCPECQEISFKSIPYIFYNKSIQNEYMLIGFVLE
jgi:hypothetical protein